MSVRDDEEPKRTGIETVVWNNLAGGWVFYCLCGWSTVASDALSDGAGEMEEHWEDEHGWPA